MGSSESSLPYSSQSENGTKGVFSGWAALVLAGLAFVSFVSAAIIIWSIRRWVYLEERERMKPFWTLPREREAQ